MDPASNNDSSSRFPFEHGSAASSAFISFQQRWVAAKQWRPSSAGMRCTLLGPIGHATGDLAGVGNTVSQCEGSSLSPSSLAFRRAGFSSSMRELPDGGHGGRSTWQWRTAVTTKSELRQCGLSVGGWWFWKCGVGWFDFGRTKKKKLMIGI
ncbi:PREDICTED: uncharacterized protein LOC109164712 isoform X2 [Ipomoea nil]|uniref:uncharacterized protein LOC109164712 isoform X2 n=1 Tax=Ipomoea nil TaxID=35883 RepID=UPI000901BB0B|nr:PREDICTED: uncharacterized protein LOC109164712 isoform X2 [Ipomoea nil]